MERLPCGNGDPGRYSGKMRMAPDVVDKSERVLATCEKVVALYEQQTVVRQALAGKFT